MRCVTQVLVLALPAFVILVVAVRRCAPTDLVQAGVAVGMGAIGVLGYSLGCTTDDPTVIAWRYGVAILGLGPDRRQGRPALVGTHEKDDAQHHEQPSERCACLACALRPEPVALAAPPTPAIINIQR